MTYEIVKTFHIITVYLSVVLFNFRFILKMIESTRTLPKLLRVLPHVIDTLLFISGLWLIYLIHAIPFVNALWLGVKLILLVCYILLGTATLKLPNHQISCKISYCLAMLCFIGMGIAAIVKF